MPSFFGRDNDDRYTKYCYPDDFSVGYSYPRVDKVTRGTRYVISTKSSNNRCNHGTLMYSTVYYIPINKPGIIH